MMRTTADTRKGTMKSTWRIVTIIVVGAALGAVTAWKASITRERALQEADYTRLSYQTLIGSRINHERLRSVEEATGIAIWKPYLAAQAIAETGCKAAGTQEVAAMNAFFKRLSSSESYDDDARRDLLSATKWNKIMAKYYCDESLYRMPNNWYELKSGILGTTPNEEIGWCADLFLPAMWSDDVEKAASMAMVIAGIVARGDGREHRMLTRPFVIPTKRREELRQLLVHERNVRQRHA